VCGSSLKMTLYNQKLQLLLVCHPKSAQDRSIPSE
jgi:hypothetical protein